MQGKTVGVLALNKNGLHACPGGAGDIPGVRRDQHESCSAPPSPLMFRDRGLSKPGKTGPEVVGPDWAE